MPCDKEKLNVINLLGGSYPAAIEGREYFKFLVHKYHGKLHVLTHAFHEEEEINPYYPRAKDYLKKRDSFINACLKNEVPLLLFEKFEDIGKLPQRIQTEGTIFRVATEDKAGWLFDHHQQWPVLVRILKDACVRHIIAGGQNMVFKKIPDSESIVDPDYKKYILLFNEICRTSKYSKSWLERGIFPSECAGGISRLLAKAGFEVTLSPISSPDNYWDIVKNEYSSKK